MCCPRMFRGRTFQWLKRFIIFCTIVALVGQLIQILLGVCTNSSEVHAGFCNFRGFMIIIAVVLGVLALGFLALFVYIRFLRRFLALRFPVSCGHTKCIFTGKSSKTLSELLLTIDKELPTEEVYEDEQNTVLRFLEDIRKKLQTTLGLSTEPILVGSAAERYGIPFGCKKAKTKEYVIALKTDIDVMLCFDHEKIEASLFGLVGNIRVVPIIEPFLGYAHLCTLNESGDAIEVISSKVMEKVKHALSCTKITNFPRFKCCFGKCESFGYLNYEVKGPAVNVSMPPIVNCDITPCIKCRKWPPQSDWPRRARHWPSQEDVTRIESNGCHLVAKPEPSDKEQTSWRFSFSVAEVELSRLVPNTARKCLLALKIIFKDHLRPLLSFSSYALKNVFLNALEKTPVDFWEDDNIEQCFLYLLDEFHDALVSGNCPHHWFSSVNLFRQLKERYPEEIAVLIKKLKVIAKKPAPFIFDDGCFCLCPCCTIEGHQNTSLESVDHMKGTSEQAVIINV